jgi:hypothetical protein
MDSINWTVALVSGLIYSMDEGKADCNSVLGLALLGVLD